LAGSFAHKERSHEQWGGFSERSGNALIRGGYWNSNSNAGVFNLNNDNPENRNDNVGFR
jgi:hypothetical protein